MNKKLFQKFLNRDETSVVTGNFGDDLVPNHRINRSVGGTDNPSNIVVMESVYNGLLESDALVRARAIRYGWKLESWQDPTEEPFYHYGLRKWVQPDDDFNLTVVPIPARMFRIP